MDATLSKMCEESEGKMHSGCTAVTAFLRIEDAEGKQSFLSSSTETIESQPGEGASGHSSGAESGPHSEDDSAKKPKKKPSSGSRFKKALKSLGSGSISSRPSSPTGTKGKQPAKITIPPAGSRRVLYSANAGDARGVLCRAGKAIRLTYDHKGSDQQEAKRITDAGGFVMSGRVNGVLAVTRSLGDSSMKDFVVGAPYTTETELCDDDEFLILACDGVSTSSLSTHVSTS